MPFTPESQEPRNLNLQHVIAPDRNAGVSEPQLPQDPQGERKSKKGLVLGITGGLAGAAIAAGAIIGINAAGEVPKSEPTASAPADPSETTEPFPDPSESAPEQEFTVESLEIPSTVAPEELGSTFIDRLNRSYMAGATQENLDRWNGGGYAEGTNFAKRFAPGLLDVFADAVLVSDWQSHEDLSGWIARSQDGAAGTLDLWFVTSSSGNPLDQEPFRRWDDFDVARVVSQSDTAVVTEVDATQHNNIDRNRADEIAVDPSGLRSLDGDRYTAHISWVLEGDTWKIASISFSDL